ncbi:MAG: MFS transporter [Candidatus Margulisiibacteriota bacterium]
MFSVLRNRNFMILWSGQVLSQLADRMLVGVLLLNVHYLTKNNLALSLPMLSFGLSAVIFGTIAGVYVDRWSKKKILVWSNILRAILILSFAFFSVVRESLVLIFIVSFVIFTIAQYFIPAEASCIPTIIEKDKLLGANSFFMGTWMGATVLGFGLLSFLSFLGMDLKLIYVIASGFYLLAGILITSLKLHEVPLTRTHTIKSTVRDYILGFRYVIRKRWIKYSLFKVFIASCVLAVLSELAIDFVHKILGQGSANYGFYVAFAGVGMGVSIITLHYVHKLSKDILPWIGFSISGLMLVLMTMTTNIYLVLLYIFFLGFGNGYITIPIQTVLQENVSMRMRGRVFSLQNVFISAAFTIPVILAGYLADVYSVRFVFALMGLLTLISVFGLEIRLLMVPIEQKYLHRGSK